MSNRWPVDPPGVDGGGTPARWNYAIIDGRRVEFDDLKVGDVFALHHPDGHALTDRMVVRRAPSHAGYGPAYNTELVADPAGTSE